MKKSNSTSCENCPSHSTGIFCDLAGSELADVAKHKVMNRYKKGQTLFVQGTHPFGIYCISTGNIKLTKSDASGKESIVRIAGKGDVLGHRSLFTDAQYGATATALEDTEVCFLDRKYILEVIEKQPSVSLSIINKLSRDMGAAEEKISSYHQKNVRERLAELILLLKQTHGESMEEGRYKINLRLTREEMATMIGTANETLIRFMTEFKDEGLIEQEGKVLFIKNEEKLLEWANLKL